MNIRLDRWLATLGVGSRSEVKKWIRDGSVAVGGRIIRDSALSFDTEKETLSVNGKEIDGRLMRHAVLYKPAGVLTAARDPKQPTVMDLLPPAYRSIGFMPVGRLDKDTTGILIFTCDGDLNHRLLSPGRHVDKIYRARVEGKLTMDAVETFATGMDLGDFVAQPAKLEILQAGEECSLAEVTVAEGKFHQVKRMFSAAGHEVLELHRRKFGPLELDGSLREGEWRELAEGELNSLYEAAGMEKDT